MKRPREIGRRAFLGTVLASFLTFASTSAIPLRPGFAPGLRILGGAAQAAVPDIFTRPLSALPVRLIDNGNGTFATTYNAADWKQIGTPYYVSPTGNDANDGLSAGTAKLTVQAAANAATSGSRIIIGAGRFAGATVASKNLNFEGAGVTQTFLGPILGSGDITFGALASGRQTATLATGTVQGFIDFAYTTDGQPQVSMCATSAADIANKQALGLPGIFRGAPSTVGASDGRDLSATADTTTLFWSSTAASALATTGNSKVYASGITFVGGDINAGSGTLIVHENCRTLGTSTHATTCTSTMISVNYTAVGCGSPPSSTDLLHYTGAIFVEINVSTYQASYTAPSDNASTSHTGLGMRVNGNYGGAARTIHDVNNNMVGVFGCRLRGGTSYDLAAGINANLGVTNFHVKGVKFDAASAKSLYIDQTAGGICSMYVYDQSLAGATVNGGPLTDRSAGYASVAKDYLDFDLSNLANFTTDTGGTTPIAADGDLILRLNNPANGGYYTVTTGTVTYRTSGGKRWIVFAGATLTPNGIPPFQGKCHIVMAVKSTDTSSILMAASSTQNIFDMRNVSTNPTQSIYVQGSGGYRVNGGADLATGALLRAAAFNGNGNVLTFHDADLEWTQWANAKLFNNWTGTSFTFEGSVYAMRIMQAVGGSAPLAAVEAAQATLF